jgi:hypothetical protein
MAHSHSIVISPRVYGNSIEGQQDFKDVAVILFDTTGPPNDSSALLFHSIADLRVSV